MMKAVSSAYWLSVPYVGTLQPQLLGECQGEGAGLGWKYCESWLRK